MIPSTKPFAARLLWATLLCVAGCSASRDDATPANVGSFAEFDAGPPGASGDVGVPADISRRPDVSHPPAVTSVPPPPRRPGPFDLNCARTEPPAEFDQWLADTPYCFGEGSPRFEDVTRRSHAAHFHRMPEGIEFYPHQIGGGVVLRDLNNDGALDLYLSNGAGANRLLLNDTTGHFRDCTAETATGFADDWTNGVGAADYDNDGWQDLYLANNGRDRLLHNNGDGTFTEVTDQAGLGAADNSTSTSWGDLDGDGRLDLVVAAAASHYNYRTDSYVLGKPHVYHNVGDGRFEEIDHPQLPEGASYLIPLADFDDDGDLDVLVPQEFYQATRPAYFQNDGVTSDGRVLWTDLFDPTAMPVAHAAMGLALFDANQDGRVDIEMSNLWGEPPYREVLLQNRGPASFVDTAPDTGAFALAANPNSDDSNRLISWSVVTADIDNDADQDLYLSYGHFSPGSDYSATADEYPPMTVGQRNALLENDGLGSFSLLEGTCAEDAGQGRAAVAGDINRDGCVDLVVVNQNGSTRLLQNRCDTTNHALSLTLVGRDANRDAVGALVEVTTDGNTQQRRVFDGSSSIFSAAPRTLHFGLGQADHAERIDIWWPSGTHQRIANVAATIDPLVIGEPTE